MAYKAVLFDLDGTLLDTLPDLVVISNAALREMGFPERTSEEICSFIGNGATSSMRQAVPAGTSEEKLAETMVAWRRIHQEIDGEHTFPFPGVEEALHELKDAGILLGVLTNKFNAGAQEIIGLKLPGLFDEVWGESETTPRKPDPTGMLNMMAALGVKPEETVYVGDSPSDNVVAHRAGALAVSVPWGYRDLRLMTESEDSMELADVVIEHPGELVELVLGSRG